MKGLADVQYMLIGWVYPLQNLVVSFLLRSPGLIFASYPNKMHQYLKYKYKWTDPDVKKNEGMCQVHYQEDKEISQQCWSMQKAMDVLLYTVGPGRKFKQVKP